MTYNELERQQNLFNQSHRVHITPLVIHGLGGGHTHTYIRTEVILRSQTCAWFKNNISVMEVPGNCTDCLQPLDLSINKPLKDHLKSCLHKWYAAGIRNKILTGDNDKRVIDLHLSLLKPLGFQWLNSYYNEIELAVLYTMSGPNSQMMMHLFPFSSSCSTNPMVSFTCNICMEFVVGSCLEAQCN